MLDKLLSMGMNAIGGLLGSSDKKKDRKLQADAMQHGISWRVADAKRAGVHPLYALGAPTFSPSPVSTGGYDLPSALGDMGQNIGRAAEAYTPKLDKAAQGLEALALERGHLENELLRSQIRQMNAPGTGPGVVAAPSSPVKSFPKGPLAPLAKTAPQQTITLGGLDLRVPPGNTMGQSIEDLYGESEAMNIPNMLHLLDYNMGPGGPLEPMGLRHGRLAAEWLRRQLPTFRGRTPRHGKYGERR